MDIRKAKSFDVGSIALIHAESWRDTYSEILPSNFLNDSVLSERKLHWNLTAENNTDLDGIFVAEDDGKVVGFIYINLNDDLKWGSYIDSLHVCATYRGKGLGKKLLSHAISWASVACPGSSFYLWVFEVNSRALDFYLNLGGRVVERAESEMPSANKSIALRIYWDNAKVLLDRVIAD